MRTIDGYSVEQLRRLAIIRRRQLTEQAVALRKRISDAQGKLDKVNDELRQLDQTEGLLEH